MRCLAAILLTGTLLAGCKPPEIRVSETPVRIEAERVGYGEPVEAGDVVRIDYVAQLPDGKEILRHRNFRFQIGSNSVIRGIDEAIVGMRMDGTREFVCPPHKHWGRAGYAEGLIPPATDLHIRMTLVRIDRRHRPRTVSG